MRLHTSDKGFALLLTLIISSVVLAIGLSILEISINQINLSSTARESEIAFQAAHAGVDCVWYWRNERSSSYTAQSGTPAAIDCFNGSVTADAPIDLSETTDGHARRFSYEFEWGSPLRCTQVDMYVLNATGVDDVTINFTSTAVGDNGVKTCSSGTVCTVLVSSGYNRSCSDLTSSIFTVQRELTVEF
jgi:hypothetical protein